jgi:hypothetical protein
MNGVVLAWPPVKVELVGWVWNGVGVTNAEMMSARSGSAVMMRGGKVWGSVGMMETDESGIGHFALVAVVQHSLEELRRVGYK